MLVSANTEGDYVAGLDGSGGEGGWCTARAGRAPWGEAVPSEVVMGASIAPAPAIKGYTVHVTRQNFSCPRLLSVALGGDGVDGGDGGGKRTPSAATPFLLGNTLAAAPGALIVVAPRREPVTCTIYRVRYTNAGRLTSYKPQGKTQFQARV